MVFLAIGGSSSADPVEEGIAPFEISTSAPRPESDEPFDRFVARWNAWEKALPEDQIIVHDLQRLNDELWAKRYEFESDGIYPVEVLYAEPNSEHWRLTPQIFDQHGELFDKIEEVVRRGYLFDGSIPSCEDLEEDWTCNPESRIFAYTSDGHSTLRQGLYGLAHSARFLAFHDDIKGAIGRFEAVVIANEQFDQIPTLSGRMSKDLISGHLSKLIMQVVDASEILGCTDHQLKRFQQLLISAQDLDKQDALDFAQWIGFETWTAMYEDGVYRDEFLVEMFGDEHQDQEYNVAPPVELRSKMHEISELFIQDLKNFPNDQRRRALRFDVLYSNETEEKQNRYLPVSIYQFWMRTTVGVNNRDQYLLRNNLVVIVVHRHRVRHGEWPESLDSIDPDVLPVPAIDLYSGEPLGYAYDGSRPKLWAFGSDRDDDGGRMPASPDAYNDPNQRRWFPIETWERMSEEKRTPYEGDLQLMW